MNSTFIGSILLVFLLAGNLFAQESSPPQGTQLPLPISNGKGDIKIVPLEVYPVIAQQSSSPALSQGEWIVFNLKGAGKIIGKKPRIEGKFPAPIKPESLVVMLDFVDVSLLLEKSPQGFSPKTSAF